MLRKIFLLSFLVLVLALCSCHDEVLTGGDAQPSFELAEKDCYDFGTLLTGSVSSTRKLIVHNANSGVLELQSIILRGGIESAFRINVDGMSGTSFSRSELLRMDRGDSLFVLMEVAAPVEQTEHEQLLQDYLDISCNGRTTSILLKATAMNVEQLHDSILTQNLRWDSSCHDKQIFGTLTIPQGVTLTIADSTRLFMHDKSRIDVYGSLVIEGSDLQPVTLIGDRTDKMFDNLYYRDMGGQWGGMYFHPGSTGNKLERVLMKGMSDGIRLHQDELIVRNATLMNADSALIYAVNSQMTVENSLLMNSGGPLLELRGGNYDVTHCTLANYAFWTTIRGADLLLANYAEENKAIEHCPLYHCQLTNTLIYGRSGKDPNVDLRYRSFTSPEGMVADSIFTYRFDHCLLHATGGTDDDDFIATLWTEDPLYVLIDMPNYLCDPHLQPESPARSKGTPSTLQYLPLDLDGKPRNAIPSIGCYE